MAVARGPRRDPEIEEGMIREWPICVFLYETVREKHIRAFETLTKVHISCGQFAQAAERGNALPPVCAEGRDGPVPASIHN